MSEYLFAYGTLQPGLAPIEIADLVRDLLVLGKGSVQGTLYDLGSYPGARLDNTSSHRIWGTVFRLPAGMNLIPRLDAYEEYYPESPHASQFIRKLRTAQLTDGRTLECWIYEYNGHPDATSILEGGTYTG
jgi:gamma-glutamylcyclotransferase (GGCT)/AIG2-like uncharacterized protein YtfP